MISKAPEPFLYTHIAALAYQNELCDEVASGEAINRPPQFIQASVGLEDQQFGRLAPLHSCRKAPTTRRGRASVTRSWAAKVCERTRAAGRRVVSWSPANTENAAPQGMAGRVVWWPRQKKPKSPRRHA